MRLLLWIGWLTVLSWLAPTAHAQQLIGNVQQAEPQQALPNAVVSVLDSAGNAITRTLTDRRGDFTIAVGSTGRLVEVIHIGYLPERRPVPDSARTTGNIRISVTLQRIPVQLDPVRTNGTSCALNATEANALALWDQARAGFLASVVARDLTPADAMILSYVRSVKSGRLSGQSVTVRRSVSTRLIASARPPASFAELGYLDQTPDGPYFNGPDADVLLDPTFRSTHCFSLAAANSTHPGQIGIDFQEASFTAGAADIRGTLWMDPSPLALRSLDYHYSFGSVPLTFASIGGHLTFLTADNGIILVGDWNIWRADSDSVDAGAVLLSAKWPDASTPTVSFPTIRGVVVNPQTDQPVSGVPIGVKNTNYRATTANDGSFGVNYVLPGRYTVMAFDSSLAAFGIGAVASKDVTVDRQPSPVVALPFPSVVAAARQACAGNKLGAGDGVIVMRIVDSLGALAKEPVTVHVTAVGGARPKDQSGEVWTGRLAFCGVARGTLSITATDAQGRRGAGLLNASGKAVVDTVTITLRPRAGARR